jgi:hypothetical protein
MAPSNSRANRYDHTPRKVFDKAIDRMEFKRARDRDDTRSDMRVLTRAMDNLQRQLTELREHVAGHCEQLIDPKDPVVEHSTEGLE